MVLKKIKVVFTKDGDFEATFFGKQQPILTLKLTASKFRLKVIPI